MKRQIKKSHKVLQKLRDLNNKIQHRLYKIKRLLSNLDKHLKIRNIISTLIILIYISQCIYHLSLNSFNLWYVAEVFGLGSLYIGLAYFIKEGINE